MQDRDKAFPAGESPDTAQATSSLGTGGEPESVTATPPSGTPQSDQQQGDVESDAERSPAERAASGTDGTIEGKQDTGA